MRKRYNTPHRSRVVKTRMTEEEYAEFAERLSAYNMSQAEFIRQAITGATIRPIITVSPVNDELLAAVGKLTAEYGKIGGNLNQIARTLNEWHSPYRQKHESDFIIADAAARYFRENGISKLPSYKALQAEIETLIKEKNSGYNDYRAKREEYRRLQTVKGNIDQILRRERKPVKRQEQER